MKIDYQIIVLSYVFWLAADLYPALSAKAFLDLLLMFEYAKTCQTYMSNYPCLVMW